MANEKQLTPLEAAVQTGHYPLFSMALGVAMTRSLAWRFTTTGETYDAFQLAKFAETLENDPAENSAAFYMVSIEGAIGACPGLEWQTRWLFIPILDKIERDAVLARMAKRVHEEATKVSARKQAESPAHAAPVATAAAPIAQPVPTRPAAPAPQPRPEPKPEPAPEPGPEAPEAPQPKTPARFCPECGTPYKSDSARFCISCGAPRKL